MYERACLQKPPWLTAGCFQRSSEGENTLSRSLRNKSSRTINVEVQIQLLIYCNSSHRSLQLIGENEKEQHSVAQHCGALSHTVAL